MITGTGILRQLSDTRCARLACPGNHFANSDSADDFCCITDLISRPLQKSSPLACTTTARIFRSLRNWREMSSIALNIAMSRALRFSGRLSVTKAMLFSLTKVTHFSFINLYPRAM